MVSWSRDHLQKLTSLKEDLANYGNCTWLMQMLTLAADNPKWVVVFAAIA